MNLPAGKVITYRSQPSSVYGLGASADYTLVVYRGLVQDKYLKLHKKHPSQPWEYIRTQHDIRVQEKDTKNHPVEVNKIKLAFAKEMGLDFSDVDDNFDFIDEKTAKLFHWFQYGYEQGLLAS